MFQEFCAMHGLAGGNEKEGGKRKESEGGEFRFLTGKH